jgi:hypothetical protein
LPASGIEEVVHGRRTVADGGTKKQRKKREKAAAQDAALGGEELTVEVAGVLPDLKKIMKARGMNNRQDTHHRLLKNLIDTDFITQAKMLRCVTTPFVFSEEVSRAISDQSMLMIQQDPEDIN